MRSIISSLLLSICFLFCQCQTKSTTETTSSSEKASKQKVEATSSPYANIEVSYFKQKMQEANVVVLDVRTPAEIAQGKIPDAQEIDFLGGDFKQKVEALDKDKSYLIYCKKGARSSKACEIMSQMGFTSLYNLTGGYTAWTMQ